MEENIKVDSSSHYSMPLPFNKNKKGLFDNRHRTISLKKKLDRDTAYHREFTGFMTLFVALFLSQFNVIHQGIFLAISGVIYVGFLALFGMGKPLHSCEISGLPRRLDYTGSRSQRRVQTRRIQRSRSHPSSSKRSKRRRAIKPIRSNTSLKKERYGFDSH